MPKTHQKLFKIFVTLYLNPLVTIVYGSLLILVTTDLRPNQSTLSILVMVKLTLDPIKGY